MGGDILVRSSGKPWIIGIGEPADRDVLLTAEALTGSRRACATSSIALRRESELGRDRADFVQVSVIADDVMTAHVLAVAILTGGAAALDALAAQWQVEVITVDDAGDVTMTAGATAAMTAASLG